MADFLQNLFPAAPSYLAGLLGEEQARAAQQQAQQSGLLGLGLGLLQAAAPAPVRPSLGAGLAQGLATGQQAYQNVFQQRMQEAMLGQQLADAQKKRQQQELMQRLFPQVFQTTTERGAVAGEEGPVPTQQQRMSIDPSRLQLLAAASPDPLGTLATIAKTLPELRKAGLTTGAMAGADPFAPFMAVDNPNIKAVAQQYSRAYQSGAIDEATAGQRAESLAKMAEMVEKPVGLTGEYANVALSKFNTADVRKLTPDQLASLPGLVQEQKTAVAAAGRPSIEVKTGETAANELIRSQIARTDASQAAADAASETLRISASLKPLIEEGVFSGPLSGSAQVITRLGSALGVTGDNAQQILNRTSQVMQGLSTLELEAAKGMRGQGAITESEREIIRRASAGKLGEFTSGEVKSLLNALDKTAKYRIGSHQRQVQALRNVLPAGSERFAEAYTTEYEMPEPVKVQSGRSKW